MKKILIAALFVFTSTLSSQFQYQDIGITRITDSTSYTTFNRSTLFNHNIFVKQSVILDSLGKGRIYYVGNELQIENTKENGGINFWLGQKDSRIFINRELPIFPGVYTMAIIDSSGIDLFDGGQFKMNGVPITSGSSNLYGYLHKDTAFIHNQHLVTKTFAIYRGSDSDSARFTVDGNGSLQVEPVGTDVTFGNVTGTGTKNVYAGEYYRGATNLTTYYNTNTTFSNIPYLNKKNTFTALNEFTAVDSSITAKGVKGLTGQDFLLLLSPGNGYQGIKIYNSTSAAQIFFYTGNGGALYTMDNNGFWIGDGTAGLPYISNGTPTVTNVSYSFYGDKNNGFLRIAADSNSIVTNGVSRIITGTNTITNGLRTILPELTLTTQTARPIVATTNANIYIKGGKLVVYYNNASTNIYYYLDLVASANSQWIYSATEP